MKKKKTLRQDIFVLLINIQQAPLARYHNTCHFFISWSGVSVEKKGFFETLPEVLSIESLTNSRLSDSSQNADLTSAAADVFTV